MNTLTVTNTPTVYLKAIFSNKMNDNFSEFPTTNEWMHNHAMNCLSLSHWEFSND